jgi:hypothetical protein
MNLTGKQWIAIVMAILGVLAISTSQLTDLLGPQTAKTISTAANLANTILASIMAVLTGQATLVKDVRAMPGVEKVLVNDKANETLAKIATDPAEPKVGAVDAGTRMVLQDKAKGA